MCLAARYWTNLYWTCKVHPLAAYPLNSFSVIYTYPQVMAPYSLLHGTARGHGSQFGDHWFRQIKEIMPNINHVIQQYFYFYFTMIKKVAASPCDQLICNREWNLGNFSIRTLVWPYSLFSIMFALTMITIMIFLFRLIGLQL